MTQIIMILWDTYSVTIKGYVSTKTSLTVHTVCREQVSSETNTQIVFLITESGYIFIQLCNSYLQKWGRRNGEQCRLSERVVGRKKGRRDIKDWFCLVFCAQFDDFFYAKSSVDSLKWHT